MAKKLISWKTKGMNRDTSVSAFNAEFAFENVNMRLSTNEGNTAMSWVNEKGTKLLTLQIDPVCLRKEDGSLKDDHLEEDFDQAIIGRVVGATVLNHQLVVFTVDSAKVCYIYSFKKSGKELPDLEGRMLYMGKLGFDVEHPLETLVSYESDTIQKVYWTDNLNQPRLINIAPSMDEHTRDYNDTSFDFVQELKLEETVTVDKIFGQGEFPPGVIQYAFTYYNKYGQESNIFYTTPLQYISYVDRGGKPDSKIANSFKIKILNVDKNFDYIRVYSILRTSLNAAPFCKRVQDIEIKGGFVSFTDNGLMGDSIDPTELLYKGGEEIIAETMEQKDGTLFLGNLTVKRKQLNDIKDNLLEGINGDGGTGVSKDYPLIVDTYAGDPSKVDETAIVHSTTTKRRFYLASKEPFSYINTLSYIKHNATEKLDTNEYKGIAGFKAREYYRLGVQFQYKNGQWSEPCWIGDIQEKYSPSVIGDDTLQIPGFEYHLPVEICEKLQSMGYKKIRPMFVVPKQSDRTILCQGIACPTMYRKVDRFAKAEVKTSTSNGVTTTTTTTEGEGKLYAQSSWLFRNPVNFEVAAADGKVYYGDAKNGGGLVSWDGIIKSQYSDPVLIDKNYPGSNEEKYCKAVSPYLRDSEVMGIYDDAHAFYVDNMFATIHSPELIFDDTFVNMDFNGCNLTNVGYVQMKATYGDISIQTSTPALGSDAGGFIHRNIVTDPSAALITGPFFEDYIVDDLGDDKYGAFNTDNPPVYFPVYMWHKNGSLNNDVNRSNRSAELLKKKISNYRLGGSTIYWEFDVIENPKEPTDEEPTYKGDLKYLTDDIQLFNSDTLSMIKVDGHVYMGNIETMLTPTIASPYYIIGDPYRSSQDSKIDFLSDSYFRLHVWDPNDSKSSKGLFEWAYGTWVPGTKDKAWLWHKRTDDIGKEVNGLLQWREPISMKYKSTPHLVVQLQESSHLGERGIFTDIGNNQIPLMEVSRAYNKGTMYGGTSEDAMLAATWIPCGPPVKLDSYIYSSNTDANGKPQKQVPLYVNIEYMWGDTYFQRFECLKTYPFTQEDKNQVVEIASFMCETRVNIDGRYDRNRGQTSNLNMTPQNFNLYNPVYSQMDNFFSYKMMSKEDYELTSHPNNITWTKTKENGADIDLWTNITMANTLELDGDKGEVTKLTRLNNQLIAFQDSGISQVLYNENTQISTTEGVPIEIANSQKVQGKRYYSDTVGCSNKWSMVQTPMGIYFMDSNEKSIYLFNGQLNNLSTAGGFNSWAKQNIPSSDVKWVPGKDEDNNFVTYYDRLNQDVLFIGKDKALAYSEKFSCFTSFYDYGGIPFFESLDDMGIWVYSGVGGSSLHGHQMGDYCRFFWHNKPFFMTLIANQEPQVDKIFTNLEFRACVDGEGGYDIYNKYIPNLPFDNIETWDEYQHGTITLNTRYKGGRLTHGTMDGVLERKFRIWRCDLPRDNAPLDNETESKMGIKRLDVKPLDRMRNPWIYIKLSKDAGREGVSMNKVEVHDIVATYFD